MQLRLPKRLTSLVLLAFSLGALNVASPVVGALGLDGVGVTPTDRAESAQPWFVYSLAAGQSTNDSITITNTNAQSRDVTIYAVDAVPTANNGFGMMPRDIVPTDAGSWVSLGARSLTLPPHSKQVVDFNFTVPPNATVGPHYGGLIVQPNIVTQSMNSQGTQVNVVPRVGVRIYETVPGKQSPGLTVSDLDLERKGSAITSEITVHNTGNTLLAPVGTITVKNMFGKTIDQRALTGGETLVPGSHSTIHAVTPVPAKLPQHYTVTVSFTYANQKIVQHGSIWFALWPLGVVVLLLPLGLLVILRGNKQSFR